MFLAVQGAQGKLEGPVPASDIKAVLASNSPYNSTVNRLDYAAFTDAEPEANNVSVSGYGSVPAVNASITLEFVRPLLIKSVAVQTLKAATSGSWGIHYMRSVKVQALVGAEWQTVFTFPAGLPDSSIAPDGRTYSEKWATMIPVGITCSALRLLNPNGYVCASTFAPVMG